MPQDGSNNYYYPLGTPGIPDTTIESEAYNTFLDDLVTNDLNIPRPIHRGGTGGNNVDTALANLHAEKAEQVVTEYLSHVWLPGSFRSATSATDAPVAGHSFAGICYINEPLVFPPTNANVTLEARDQNDTVVPGRKYIRQKIAGTWATAWSYEDQDVIDASTAGLALKVNLAGDVMTGHLTLPTGPAADQAVRKDYVDAAGTALDNLKVNRAGDTMTGDLNVTRAASPTTGFLLYGNSGAAFFGYDASNFISNSTFAINNQLTATQLVSSGNTLVFGSLFTGYGQATGTVYFAGGAHYLTFDGTSFNLTNQLYAPALLTGQTLQSISAPLVLGASGSLIYLRPHGVSNQTNEGTYGPDGTMSANMFSTRQGVNGGMVSKSGDSNIQSANWHNFFWNGNLNGYVDNTFLGVVSFISDYRIKKDVTDLQSTWETVKLLRPVKYTQAQYSPPSDIKNRMELAEKNKTKDIPPPLFEADDIERWGFIAHELQETMIQFAATGVKDQENCVQSPNPWVMLAAVTKALQEAMARIEALEAAG